MKSSVIGGTVGASGCQPASRSGPRSAGSRVPTVRIVGVAPRLRIACEDADDAAEAIRLEAAAIGGARS